MSKYITVRMTEAQAQELLAVAGNGYGDGDFYGLNNVGGDNGNGGRRGAQLYSRAHNAVLVALNLARQAKKQRREP